MMRGDLITIALQGDFGKPRPAVVIQSDLFEAHSSVTVLPITSALVEAPLLRITVQPTPQNGLQKTSQIMIDKALTVRKDKAGLTEGRLERETMLEIERCLAVFLGIAK
jgi:mRNA interferase MazF